MFCAGVAYPNAAVLFASGKYVRYLFSHSELDAAGSDSWRRDRRKYAIVTFSHKTLNDVKNKLNQILAEHTGETKKLWRESHRRLSISSALKEAYAVNI